MRVKLSGEIEKLGAEIAGIEKELKEALKRHEWILDNQK